MIKYFEDLWYSLPIWVWSKIMFITGLIIIFISLNYWARSARKNRIK